MSRQHALLLVIALVLTGCERDVALPLMNEQIEAVVHSEFDGSRSGEAREVAGVKFC